MDVDLKEEGMQWTRAANDAPEKMCRPIYIVRNVFLISFKFSLRQILMKIVSPSILTLECPRYICGTRMPKGGSNGTPVFSQLLDKIATKFQRLQ